MKHIKATLTVFLLCLTLAACQTSQQTENGTTAPPPEPVTVLVSGATEYQLVCPKDAGDAASALFKQFTEVLSARTNYTFQLTDDTTVNAKELLIGKVDRPETTALLKKLEAAGGDRFGICVTENTVAITGTNVYQTYLGLEHLLSNYLTANENDGVDIILPLGLEYISEAGKGLGKDDIRQLVEEHGGMIFTPVRTLVHVPNEGDFTGTQGCGTDGTYVYVGKLDNKPNDPEHGKIYKYRLDTGELVAVSESLPSNHTNDITYDPESGLLVVVGAMGSGSYMGGKLLSFVDPNTLKLVKTVTAPVYIRGLEYSPELGEYIAAGSDYTFYRMDKNFNILSSFKCQIKSYTVQGLYTDGTYIYDPRFYKGSESIHYMIVYTVDGQFVGKAALADLLGNEPEGMFIANGKYYLGCGWTHNVYEMELLPKNYWVS